jgi:flagellar basal-body rod modification protein FlgD
VASSTVNGVLGQAGAQASGRSAFDKLDLETFTKLLVTELANQDPLSPMDNAQIIQQISQIRSIEASTQLTSTLEAVLLGQNVATASGLLGRTITGLADDSRQITGVVQRVSVADGVARLHIGESTVALKNVSEILPARYF